jgi:hypothetical protein
MLSTQPADVRAVRARPRAGLLSADVGETSGSAAQEVRTLVSSSDSDTRTNIDPDDTERAA